MRHRPNPLCLVLLLAVPSVALAPQQHKKSHKMPAKAVATPDPATAAVPPPSPPPTPEHGPSTPPEVSYQAGQLTIIARNSTMGEVLNAVRQKTGAAVEMPVSSTERVVGQFGPGTPRDVMAQLLNGSHYDYVLVGSPTDPGALKEVVLTARASGPEPAPAVQNIPPVQNMQAVPEVDTESAEDTNEPPPEMQQPNTEEEAQPAQPQPGQGAPAIKTPEQLLRELQQQQQQQQNGQQPGPGRQPQE